MSEIKTIGEVENFTFENDGWYLVSHTNGFEVQDPNGDYIFTVPNQFKDLPAELLNFICAQRKSAFDEGFQSGKRVRSGEIRELLGVGESIAYCMNNHERFYHRGAF